MIDAIVWVVVFYLAIGFLFALSFVLYGVQKVDPAAERGTWGFRALLIPGATAFWPILLRRWLRRQQPREERNAHRLAAHTLAKKEEGGS